MRKLVYLFGAAAFALAVFSCSKNVSTAEEGSATDSVTTVDSVASADSTKAVPARPEAKEKKEKKEKKPAAASAKVDSLITLLEASAKNATGGTAFMKGRMEGAKILNELQGLQGEMNDAQHKRFLEADKAWRRAYKK